MIPANSHMTNNRYDPGIYFKPKNDQIIMRLEEEEEEDAGKVEDLKEKQKRLREEMLKKMREKKDPAQKKDSDQRKIKH